MPLPHHEATLTIAAQHRSELHCLVVTPPHNRNALFT